MPSKVLKGTEAAETPLTHYHGAVERSEHQDLVFRTHGLCAITESSLKGFHTSWRLLNATGVAYLRRVGGAMEYYDVLKAANKRQYTQDDIEPMKQIPDKKQRLT